MPVDDLAWIGRRQRGEHMDLTDSRGARRRWTVVDADDGCCIVAATKTAYVTTGLALVVETASGPDATLVVELPHVEQAHRVRVGDRVILTRSLNAAPAMSPRPVSNRESSG